MEETDVNSRKSLYDIESFYNKKAKLKASFKGMRYQIEQSLDNDGNKKLCVCVWPEPFCYEKTPADLKVIEKFEYTEYGLDLAYEWLCAYYKVSM